LYLKINNGRRCNYLTNFVSFSLSSRFAGLVQQRIILHTACNFDKFVRCAILGLLISVCVV
ncbi:hypothetical protein, partial [Plebeiibacterium sediminum]